MRYINANVENFARYIKKNKKKIILFGAGTVCRTFVPYIFNKYDLNNSILCIIDNNEAKQGTYVCIKNQNILVKNIGILSKYKEDFCVLITNGEFYSVMQQLDNIEACHNKECFIAAYMQMDRVYDKSLNSVFIDSLNPIIPKRINYCWFSGKPIPDPLKRCISTWKEMCEGYEFIKWDESNYDINKYNYTREAYSAQKWGFIPDIVRLDILYEVGGFYFDTDVEIIRNIDELCYQDAFCGRERAGHVNFGGGSGSKPRNSIICELLDFRKDILFFLDRGKYNTEASGYFETTPLMSRGLVLEDINQKIDGINVYASEFFSPYNYINGEEITNYNTFSIHHFNGSWLDSGNVLRKETREQYNIVKQTLEGLDIKV